MKKVIIVDHEPLSIRRKMIFCIEELRVRGLDVEFWDCSRMFYPTMEIVDTLNESYIRTINSIETLNNYLQDTDIKNSIFVLEVFDNWENRKFFKLFSERKYYTIKIELYANSNLPDLSIAEKVRYSSPLKLIDAIWNKFSQKMLWFYKKYHHIRGFQTVISSENSASVDIKINHPDWELFNSIQLSECQKAQVVFLDEYFPLHPDLECFIKDYHAKSEPYYNSMNRFFSDYEKNTHNNIIIAAHPKSKYSGTEFENRELVKYKTAMLVKESQAVFMHSSSSISFAIMANKPIALLQTDGYKKTFALATQMERIARLLGLPIYNVDHVSAAEIIPRIINQSFREKYVYNYLTSAGNERKCNADILYDFFSKI